MSGLYRSKPWSFANQVILANRRWFGAYGQTLRPLKKMKNSPFFALFHFHIWMLISIPLNLINLINLINLNLFQIISLSSFLNRVIRHSVDFLRDWFLINRILFFKDIFLFRSSVSLCFRVFMFSPFLFCRRCSPVMLLYVEM